MNTDNKSYKLLKDWPDSKIGDIFQFNGQGYSNQNRTAIVVSSKYVECYTSFFELISIPLQVETNSFFWTDELVHEFTTNIQSDFNKGHSLKSSLEKFKQSKSPASTSAEWEGIAHEAKLWVVADLISRIYHYGKFKIETPNERTLAGLLNELGLFPTTEDKILMRPDFNYYNERYLNFQLPTNVQPNKEDNPVDDKTKTFEDNLNTAYNMGIYHAIYAIKEFKLISEYELIQALNHLKNKPKA